MKLLLDQNLSFRILKNLSKLFPDSNHVKNIGLCDSSDIEIYNYAKANNYLIITFDSDFLDIALMKGSPPKLIWINTGNLTSKAVLELLEKNEKLIKEFSKSFESILEIN